jgi:plastocyanin
MSLNGFRHRRALKPLTAIAVMLSLGGVATTPEHHYVRNAVDADTTIVVRAAGSTLEFVPPAISAKNGTHVRIRFINEGTLPHNIVVPRKDDDIDALALAAYEAGESGYVPLSRREQLVAYSTLASPGETVEISFVMPPPGQYTYVCLFPGHANSMLGTRRSLR